MLNFEFEALSTLWIIEIFDDINTSILGDLSSDIQYYAKDFQKKYNRFYDDSLVYSLNKHRKLYTNDPILLELLKLSKYYYDITDKYFNIFIGTLLEKNGYGKIYNQEEFNSSSSNPHNIIITGSYIEIMCEGNIDFGGIGKAYLINEIRRIILDKYNIEYFIINGGGDIFATSNVGNPIEIFIEDPKNEKQYINSIFLKDEALCCSSPYKRKWKNRDNDFTHIINPVQNNYKLESSVTIHKNIIDCDIWATMCCIMPKEIIHKKSLEYGFEYKIIN